LVDQIVALGERGGGEPEGADIGRGVLEAAQPLAANLDLLDLERRARRRKLGPCGPQFLVVHARRLSLRAVTSPPQMRLLIARGAARQASTPRHRPASLRRGREGGVRWTARR